MSFTERHATKAAPTLIEDSVLNSSVFMQFARCAVIAASVVGCGGASAGSPERVVREFAAALSAHDYAAAYGMMSSTYRRRVTQEEFERHLADNPAEASAAVNALAHPENEAEQVAVVELADGDEVELRNESGSWRLATNVVDFYDQSTPRSALRSFIRALERERYDIVMRFVPNADSEGMSPDSMRAAWSGDGREEISRLISSLRTAFDNPIEEVGDRATMRYGDAQASVQFVREGGLWKIEDPD